MRITVRQLKALIREAAAEAADDMKEGVGMDMEGSDMEEAAGAEEEAALHEAVTRAFRAGFQRGVKAATARRSRR